MRDSLKDEGYFLEFIEETFSLIEQSDRRFEKGIIPNDRIKWYWYGNFEKNLSILSALYSLGENLSKIKGQYLITLKDFSKGWSEDITKVKGKSNNNISIWDQYLVSPYFLMLQMLSLGYVLNISDQDFRILIDILDRDNVSDSLYEFIIKARFPNRKQKRPEEYYPKQSVILKVYDKLRKAIRQADKVKSAKLIQQFLEKSFYHKHSNFYEFHKKNYNAYYGYWSFEAAAIVKIMGLDDSLFIENQYYPQDLVHQRKEEPKKKGFI